MTDPLTMIGWKPLADDAGWEDRRNELTAEPGVLSASLFDVLDGDCAFVCISELTSPPAETDGTAVYRQVFNAPDVRSYTEISDYLFVVRADIEPPDPEEFEHWYNEVHVPDVGAAGLGRSRRFHATGSGPKYLATYEITSPAVMESEALQKVRGFHQYTTYVKDIHRWILRPVTQSVDSD
jgi:hypothetical protein